METLTPNAQQENENKNSTNQQQSSESTKEESDETNYNPDTSSEEQDKQAKTPPQKKQKAAVAAKSAAVGSSPSIKGRQLPPVQTRRATARAAFKRAEDAKHSILHFDNIDEVIQDLTKSSDSESSKKEPASDQEASSDSLTSTLSRIPKRLDMKSYRAQRFIQILENAEKVPSPIQIQNNRSLNQKQLSFLHALGLAENGVILKVTKFPLQKVLESGKAPFDELNTAMKATLDPGFHPWVARLHKEFVKAITNWQNMEGTLRKNQEHKKLSKLFKQQQNIINKAIIDNDEDIHQKTDLLKATTELKIKTQKLLNSKTNKNLAQYNRGEFIKTHLQEFMAQIIETTQSLVNQVKVIEIIVGLAEIHNIISFNTNMPSINGAHLIKGESPNINSSHEEIMAPAQYTPASLAQLIAQKASAKPQDFRKRSRSTETHNTTTQPPVLINPFAPEFYEFIQGARTRNQSASSRGSQRSFSSYIQQPTRGRSNWRGGNPRTRGGRGQSRERHF